MGYAFPAIVMMMVLLSCDQAEVTDDLMLLTYEKCCMLQCQKVGHD